MADFDSWLLLVGTSSPTSIHPSPASSTLLPFEAGTESATLLAEGDIRGALRAAAREGLFPNEIEESSLGVWALLLFMCYFLYTRYKS